MHAGGFETDAELNLFFIFIFFVQSFTNTGTPQYAQLQSLRESLVLARTSRDINNALSLLQKAVEGLLEPSPHPINELDAATSQVQILSY